MSKTMIAGVILAAALAGFAGAHLGQRMGSGWGPGWGANWGPGMMRGGGGSDGSGYGPMAGRGYGPGMMRRGDDAGYGYGPMMGGGYGPGVMRGWRDEAEDLNLTVEQVTKRFERRLAMHGNDRVKLGAVAEKDANTITVDIVTADKAGLVERFTVDRQSGAMRRSDG